MDSKVIEIPSSELRMLGEFAASTKTVLERVEQLLDRQQDMLEAHQVAIHQLKSETMVIKQEIKSVPDHRVSIDQLSRELLLQGQELKSISQAIASQRNWMGMLSGTVLAGLVVALFAWVLPNVRIATPKTVATVNLDCPIVASGGDRG